MNHRHENGARHSPEDQLCFKNAHQIGAKVAGDIDMIIYFRKCLEEVYIKQKTEEHTRFFRNKTSVANKFLTQHNAIRRISILRIYVEP